jgi:hypothetical protein
LKGGEESAHVALYRLFLCVVGGISLSLRGGMCVKAVHFRGHHIRSRSPNLNTRGAPRKSRAMRKIRAYVCCRVGSERGGGRWQKCAATGTSNVPTHCEKSILGQISPKGRRLVWYHGDTIRVNTALRDCLLRAGRWGGGRRAEGHAQHIEERKSAALKLATGS